MSAASTWRAAFPNAEATASAPPPTLPKGERGKLRRAAPLTQLEWARAGVITKEMIYIAERENLGRKKHAGRRAGRA